MNNSLHIRQRPKYRKTSFPSFLEKHPDLAQKWDYEKNKNLKDSDGLDISTPDKVTPCSNARVWWKCDKGHSWNAPVSSITKGCGCTICCNKTIIVGYNDLTTTHPDIASEWHPTKNGDLKPTDVTYGSLKNVWWKCKYGHEWKTTPNNRCKGHGCPYCSHRFPVVGENDLCTTHPQIANEWHPTKNSKLKPTDVMAGSNKKVWWKCKHGHEWQAIINERTKGLICPYCSGVKCIPGETDFATLHPDLMKEWDWNKNTGVDPYSLRETSDKKVWWTCELGHSWQTTVRRRVERRSGCHYCTGQKVWPNFNDFASCHPELLSEWDFDKNDKLPSEYTHCSGQKVWWQCSKKHSWYAKISNRVNGRMCPMCNISRGEATVRNTLISYGVPFKEQNTFNDRKSLFGGLLRDDFVILKQDDVVGAIEYHGEQHYYPVDFAGKGEAWAKEQLRITKERDKAKTQYLQEHGIPQLIISYKDFDKINVLIENFLQKLNLINN